jgi:probable phosphoglycerate mutase
MMRESGTGSLFGEARPEQGAERRAASGSKTGGEWITAYCDGGSRGNPGPAGFGVYIEGAKGEKLAELSEYLGKATNNVAEYSGLLAALEYALQAGYGRLRVVADSELMVKQMQGKYKVNSPDLRPLYEEAKRRASRLDGFRIEHVLRGKNTNADRLANLAMDRGMGRPVRAGAGNEPATRHAGQSGLPEREKVAKGFVKGGVVHLIEGELPDGTFVRVVPDRQ